MSESGYEGFKELVRLLKANGYFFDTFEYTDIWKKWSVDVAGMPTGIRKFGLGLIKRNKVVFPTIDISYKHLEIIREVENECF